MKILSFEEWRDQEIAKLGEDFIEKCDACDNTGTVECDMGHSHECSACYGVGGHDKRKDLTQIVYEQAVFEDCVALAAWVTSYKQAFWPEFEESQKVRPYSSLDYKSLQFERI